MGLLRKLREFGSAHILPLFDGKQSTKNDGNAPDLDYGPLPQSFFHAVNAAREDAGFDALPINARKSVRKRDEHFMNHNMRPEFGAFDRNRRPSNEQRFDRSARHGSPDQFRRLPPGTPIKFRRRPISPELLQPSASAPSIFGQHPGPASPDLLRHFQHEQQIPYVARQQQQQQFDRMMPPSAQFYPQFQQPLYPMMYPNANVQNWFMMSQYPQQMYPFY
ncbi:hypothetical protein I4U23_012701 [Adineta vaga]|nr:hypothetical protein I4U23_012701 [Adineta vaga]